ncbi:hypothetical protein PHYPSEUDO_013462 [Phytophthora pseudosyringae]|uniref:Uncharacterized protein n=1 Tax=Phytophthora pseudosyringae TaxID=221518 RepID=A0A8T1WKN4_9STRA|nr:hypothetical protein PHYPSEUDO_013462 [Phytophthora pseudosyringae]
MAEEVQRKESAVISRVSRRADTQTHTTGRRSPRFRFRSHSAAAASSSKRRHQRARPGTPGADSRRRVPAPNRPRPFLPAPSAVSAPPRPGVTLPFGSASSSPAVVMSASWDSDLSSIIEKTNNNLKLLRKIGDKPQARAPDVSVTAGQPALARPRAYVGAQDDAGSSSSRGSARPRAFVRGDDDTSSMGSHGSARPRAYVRGDEDTGSMGSHGSARPKAFIRADDDSGSVSSRASARPKAFIRADDDGGSMSSRSSARPKAFIRGDDDTGSMSSRSSARPKAFIRGDDDSGSMSSNQGLGRSRLDSGHGSASSSGRPHVGIAGGGGLTAAMLQQHRATAGPAGLAMADLGAQRSRLDLDETRSMSGVSASRLRRPLGANGRVPHARALGASLGPGPRIRVPESDIPSDIPNHVVDEIKKSLETHFASRNGAVDKKVADLRTDVAGLATQTSSLGSQISELRDAVLVSANSKPSATTPSVSDPKIIASVHANAAAIARLEEHSADLLGRKVGVDRELTELGSRVKALSSATMKISTMDDNIEALVANRQKQEQGLFKLADRVQLMHRQMGSLVDMKAVENLLSIRLTREFREMEDRLSQNVIRMAEKMEQKVQSMEKQSFSQRQESLAALKSDLSDDIQRLQSSALRKSDLLPIQNAQTQSKEDLAQLSGALDRQEKKLHDAKLANSTLRDELADARAELNKALQSQQRSAAALMEEKLEAITSSNKQKSNKTDDQLSELAMKQTKLEEATKTLQETMTQVKAEAGQRLSRSSADREEENDKLRQRLARSVAELEALATTKSEVERRFASEEEQFQARLKELRTSLTETEKQKEAQRLELMQKLQEESKLMGVAQGKNSLLENLLAREKAENEEKNELARKSKKEVAEVREQIRNLESDKEKKVRQLTSELQAKQTQVGLLTKTLKRIETASAKMLDLSKREAKTVRRVKATKEHELFIAQLKLKEMERVAQALQNGDEMKKQAALTAASTEERNELEKLLLDSQLEKDELKQELEEMSVEFNAAKESQKVIMEDTITKLSSDYDEKISELKQQITDKEQAMRQLRDTLVEKSNLDALEDELTSLKDEKNDLLEQIQRAQIEHERVTLKTETNLRLEHATEFAAMKSKFEDRISELESAKSDLETTKATIAELEKELQEQEDLHQREVSNLTHEIKEARSKIDECTAQILDLEEVKARLEGEVSQMEANIGGASAERVEELAAIKSQMQSEVDKLRAELAEVSSTLEEKQTQLKDAKQSDEANRERLVEMAMAQEEMQSRYVSQIDSLTLKLNQERESSRAREQELEDTIDKLNADVKSLKAESNKELEAARSELTDQLTELTTTLKTSQHREQQLQSRLKRILEELVQAANASGENEVSEDAEVSDDEAITHHLDALYATHRRTAHELERLQAEYELTVKQAAADSATAQELDNQVKEHETQIKELESVVEQLREELKEQYHKSAIIAKGSDEFSDEMVSLREEKRQLERQLQEEEKDRAKREVSYQRRTEMKEREVEELRTENKTLTAAVAAVREKIRAVENVKYHDLGELQNKLMDLEERTAALQPDENNVATMETGFTATRQEIVTLTAEVQSLYQKLTVCCGIMEWSELRASVFDEEEKLTRVRSESARELAKVESVEQEVLMNAEFLNALLVAHGSTGSDGDLLNDFRWMQKYASIAPEIVEKLRKVESRLRDAVLDLHDGSTSLFPEGSKVPLSKNSVGEAVAQPPNSQKSAVDGAAIALALEKAKEDYFTETSEAAQDLDDEEVKQDVDQPDVEQESPVDQEGEGASHENVAVEDQDSIGDMSHDESGTYDDELVVAEYVVHDEQERSREEQGSTSVAMPNLDQDEELSVGIAEDSFKDEQDRNDDDDVAGLVSSVDRKIEEMARIQSKWSSVGFSGDGEDDDMDEVERLMLERSLAHSSKQVKPHIDNECDDSDEFATTIVRAATEAKQPEAVSDEVGENSAGEDELSEAEQDVRFEEEEEADDLDPLDESSFDNVMVSALESRGESHSSFSSHEVPRRTAQIYDAEADQSDSEGYVVPENDTENAEENSDTRFGNDAGTHQIDVNAIVENASIELSPAEQNSELESSLDGDALSDSEVLGAKVDELVVDQVGGDQLVDDDALEEAAASMASGELADQVEVDQNGEASSVANDVVPADRLDRGNVLEEPSSSMPEESSADVGHVSTFSLERGAGAGEFAEGSELEESSVSAASNALENSADEVNELEELAPSVERGALADQKEEDEALEQSSSSVRSAALGDSADEENSLEGSAASLNSFRRKQLHEDNALEESSTSLGQGAVADGFDEDNALEQSAASIASAEDVNDSEESAASVRSVTPLEGGNATYGSVPKAENAALELDASSSSEESAARLDNMSEISADKTSSRRTHDDPLALQGGDDDIHVEHGAVFDSRSDLLESSFDADMQSDREEEASASSDAELTALAVKHHEEDEDAWAGEQLRAAERSLGRAFATPENDHEAGESVQVVPALHMVDDESSEEEETMETQPAFSTNSSRFGMGARRLNLEEDDEMDEIERLLLDENAASTQKRQQQTSGLARVDDDDEFGETSLQSRSGGDDEFGESSLQSRGDDEGEFGEASLQSHGDGEFGEASIRSREGGQAGSSSVRSRGGEFGEASIGSRSHDEDEDEFGEASVESRGGKPLEVPNTPRVQEASRYGASTRSELHEEDEFGEGSIRSRDEDEDEFEGSIPTGPYDDEADFGEISIPLQEDTGIPPAPSRLETGSVAARSADVNDGGMVYHEGLMSSPVKLSRIPTPAATRDDTTGEENSLEESAASLNSFGRKQLHEDNALEESSTSLGQGAVADGFDEDNALEQSAASIASAEDVNDSEESAASVRSVTPLEGGNATYGSVPKAENAALELDASSSSEESAARLDNMSEISADKTSSRRTHDDPLALQGGDDDIHVEHGAVFDSRSDLLESSFDADMQSDREEEASASSDAELTALAVKHHEEDEDAWAGEQLRAAERSLGRAFATPENDHEAGESVQVVPALHMVDDESSEEEETMETQPAFSTNSSRFGMGARRLNLEEDDEMDEIERLLLDENAASTQKRQQQTSGLARVDDDDEFGESSLQSRSDDVDEFGEASLQSRDHGDGEFGEGSIRSQKDGGFGQITGPREDEYGVRLDSNEKQQQQQRPTTNEEDEFGESSLQSRGDDEGEFGDDSIRSQEDNEFGPTADSRDDRYGERSVRLDSNEQEHQQQANRLARFTRPLVTDDDEFGEASLQSHTDDDGDYGEASIQSREGGYAGSSSVRSRGGEYDEASIGSRSHDEDEFGEGKPLKVRNTPRVQEESRYGASIRPELHERGELGEALSTFRGSNQFGSTPIRSHPRDEGGLVDASIRSHEEDEFGEGSIPTGSYDDEDDFGEISIPLEEDAPASSRLQTGSVAGRSSDVNDGGMTYHEGLMSSPVKLSRIPTPAATRDDSASEVEGDYMDDSFDLDESLEEEDDNGERHV